MVENMIHIDAERLNRQYFYRGIKRLFDVVASAIRGGGHQFRYC
ncbi:hypothetical protein ACW185_04680 [Limosilactobacillus fermentum]